MATNQQRPIEKYSYTHMSHIHTYTHTYKSILIPKSHISTQCLQVLQQVASLRLFSHTNELVPENIRDVRTATNREGHVLDMLERGLLAKKESRVRENHGTILIICPSACPELIST